MTIENVTASAAFTLDQTTDTLVGAMTLSPAAGDYMAVASMTFLGGAAAQVVTVSIYVGGSQIADTERSFDVEGSIVGRDFTVCTSGWITPTAGQAVELRYRVSASSGTANQRAITLFPKAASDFQEASATGTLTGLAATTDTQLGSMTLTPGAGDYLLVFSTTAENETAGGTTDRIFFTVYVNGASLTHTPRRYLAEASISAATGRVVFMIACKVSPAAGQVVEIRYRVSAAADTFACYQRTMTLMKVDAADIFQATDTVSDTGTETADTLIDNMTLTPGTDVPYLAIYTSAQFFGTLAAGNSNGVVYSIYAAGSQVTNSQREHWHDDSIDSADYPAMTHAVASPGGAGAVQARARGEFLSSVLTRTIYERTLVLVKEAGGAPAGHPAARRLGLARHMRPVPIGAEGGVKVF